MTDRDVEYAVKPESEVPQGNHVPSRKSYLTVLLELTLLAGIVAAALVLRFTGITWGTGYFLHPDELFLTSVLINVSAPAGVSEYFNSATSPLNPFNHGTGFIYGTFPLFAAKLVASFTEYTVVNNGHIPGRWLSALADTGTVVLVWWIGRMLWNRWTGLLAALLMAFTVLHIGAAHYFTTDAWSAFFATASFAFVLAGWRHRRWMFFALAGLMVGLAASSKPTLFAAFGFLVLPVLEAVRLYGWRAVVPRWPEFAAEDDDGERDFPIVLASALALFVAIWTIRIAQPYMFAGPSLFSFRLDPRWVADIDYWRNVQSGVIDYYPGIQWTERAPIVYHLKHMTLWGMGPGLAIAALGGLSWQLWRIVTGRRWPSWITLGLVGWICFHILYFGIGLAKTQRYLMPAYPFLVLLAAAVLMASLRWAWSRGSLRLSGVGWSCRVPRWLHPGFVLPAIAISSTLFYGAAYVSIYSSPQTRETASEWITANVPDGSTIANEYWDLGLPVGVPSLAERTYDFEILHPYADENQGKLTGLIGTLQQTDYIVLSSDRLRETIPRMPWRYPMATRYYEALYSGELGFDQVAHFTSFPELFGIGIDDRSAEEALTVYDHPEVTIFRKSERWEVHAAWYLLDEALGHGGLGNLPIQTQPGAMMLDAADRQQVRTQPAWSSIFDIGSISNRFPVVTWYLALQILTLPAVPILWRAMPWLPDRGYALSKTLGLFAVAWIAWWLASIRVLEFGFVPIAIGWLAVFVGGVLAIRSCAPRLVTDARATWQWIVATEVILAGGFLVAVWSRVHHPDLWIPGRAGSQLQDMATFNATALAPYFPAYDPWLVDGTIHDFTFGFVPWAVMTRLTGIVPEVAFSLSLASLVALALLTSWIAASVLAARVWKTGTQWGPILGGLLAPVLLFGIGSWGMAMRVGSGDWGPNFEGSLPDAIDGIWSTFSLPPIVPVGSWLATDRFVGPGTLEFPLLSFLIGEMSVHLLAAPLFLAGIAMLFGFLTQRPAAIPVGGRIAAALDNSRSPAGFLICLGIAIGWTGAANPLFGVALFGLSGMLLFLAICSRRLWRGSWLILRDWGVALVTTGAVATLAVVPFILSHGRLATTTLPLIQPISVDDFIGHFGAGFAIAVGYVLWQVWGLAASTREIEGVGWFGVVGFGLFATAALGLTYVVGHLAIFLILLVLLSGFLVWHLHDHLSHLMVLGSIAAALAMGIVANRVLIATWTPEQNIPMQMSFATWLLLATVVPAIVALAVRAGWERGSALQMTARRTLTSASLVAIAVLVAVGAVYPALGVPDRRDARLVQISPTLDSYAFMESAALNLNANNGLVEPYDLAGDLAAIEWMRTNLSGLPTIIEAPGIGPGWAGRISAFTGYPTVVGVTAVQNQQRPGMERLIAWRFSDVTEIYSSEGSFAEIEPVLRDYGVQIVYVGALERATYPASALAKFDEAVGDGVLEVIYEENGVMIYFYGGPRESREPSG